MLRREFSMGQKRASSGSDRSRGSVCTMQFSRNSPLSLFFVVQVTALPRKECVERADGHSFFAHIKIT